MRFCPICGHEGPGPTCPTDGVTLIDKPREVNLLGTTLKGTYRIDRKIGEGGFGVVYEGTQLALGRRVAIKTLLPGLEKDPSLVTRFFREARLLSQLSHNNIVHVYDCGNTEQGVFFLVMELLVGSPLSEVVPANVGLPFATALALFNEICAGVQEAHRVGLVHRDLKPANVFLAGKDGSPTVVKVLDFGLARHVTMDTHITREGFMLGTPGYAAPEQITATAEPDARSDIYGLGAVFYFMLAGRNPFGGQSPQSIMSRQLSAGPDPLPAAPPNVPLAVQAAIFKALEAAPEQRFQSVAELWQSISTAARAVGGGNAAPKTAALPTAMPRTAVLPVTPGASVAKLPPTAMLPVGALPSLGGVEVSAHSQVSQVTATQLRKPSRRKLLAGGAVAGFGAAGFGVGVKLSGNNRGPIRLGTSGPFSGPAQLLGRAMHTGLEARFHAAEIDGELPRPVALIALDDGYEPARAKANMQKLLTGAHVLAVVGSVGTACTAESLPLILQHKTPLIGALTGAPLVRKSPPDRYVFNYRASYAQETAAMIDHFVVGRRIHASKIAVFMQDDSYGQAGLDGVLAHLRRNSLANTDELLRVTYERNSLDVSHAVQVVTDHSAKIEAVVMIATYRAAARFIDGLRQRKIEKIYANVSFVGSEALAEDLRAMGDAPKEAIVTQVVPHPYADATGVIKYRETLARFFPEESPSFVSLEGYVVASLVVEALKRCQKFDQEELINALESTKSLDLGLGSLIDFGPSDHEGSDKVWGTVLGKDFRYESLDLES